MLHTANFYINLKREAIERHGAHKLEVAALTKYENERDMLENWLEENQS